MMRKTSWTIPIVLLFVAMGAPIAHAQTYDVNFTCENACAQPLVPLPVSFTTPPTVGVFYSELPGTIGVTLGATDSPNDSYQYFAFQSCSFLASFCSEEILINDTTSGIGSTADEFTGFFPVSEFNSGGTVTFTEVSATPEPGTAVLWLTGIGLMIVMMRKRSTQGLPQAR